MFSGLTSESGQVGTSALLTTGWVPYARLATDASTEELRAALQAVTGILAPLPPGTQRGDSDPPCVLALPRSEHGPPYTALYHVTQVPAPIGEDDTVHLPPRAELHAQHAIEVPQNFLRSVVIADCEILLGTPIQGQWNPDAALRGRDA